METGKPNNNSTDREDLEAILIQNKREWDGDTPEQVIGLGIISGFFLSALGYGLITGEIKRWEEAMGVGIVALLTLFPFGIIYGVRALGGSYTDHTLKKESQYMDFMQACRRGGCDPNQLDKRWYERAIDSVCNYFS